MTTPTTPTTPTTGEHGPDPRLDPAAAHRHSPRCFWDLHHAGWRCPPTQRDGAGPTSGAAPSR